ncbi:MAG: hypothetical protein Q9222_001179 [Ikaeria aurantiellina]
MPTLKQLTCCVEWSASGPSLPLQEYGTTYFDGLVETYIQVPPIATPFSIRLKSDGYIAPGLSMFVYIDGEYQCNRGRNNLRIPTGVTQKHHTNVDFVVRQKEESVSSGGFVGAQWTFGAPDRCSQGSVDYKNEYAGLIEVVVLRSHELQRSTAPDPSVSEVHPLAFQTQLNNSRGGDLGIQGIPPASTTNAPFHDISGATTLHPVQGSISDYYGLFDGSSDVNKYQQTAMPFGGDMTWDEEKKNRGPHFDRDWTSRSRDSQQYGNANKQQNYESLMHVGKSGSHRGASPAIVINVNQPPQEPPRSGAIGGSVADSWASLRPSLLGSVSGISAGQKPENTDGNGWQTWQNGAQQQSTPTRHGDWRSPMSERPQNSSNQSSSSGSRNTQNNVHNSGNWAKDDNAGWNNQEGVNSQHQASDGWENHGKPDSNKNYGNNDDGHWDSGHNEGAGQGWDSNEPKIEEGWNTGGNHGQTDNGWNDSGYDQANNDQYGNQDNNQDYNQDYHQVNDQPYDQGNNNHGESGYDSGRNWNDVNIGSNVHQASTGPGWNLPDQNQNGWGQEGSTNDMFQATAGGSDPSKPRSRKASTGKAKSTRSNLSRQASVNAAVQQLNWGPQKSAQEGMGGLTQFGQQRTEPPAWPNTKQPSATGFGAHGDRTNGLYKPYHIFQDAAGNPRLHAMPLQPILPPPPPAPVEPIKMSGRVQTGKPVAYQHKTASPKYIDTHDKPYAVFIFKYRTKGVLEQILNTTIPDSDDIEKAKLVHLSKEELIEQLTLKQSQLGSKANSFSVSSLTNAPASANNPNQNRADIAGPGPSGTNFGAALNDKLAALAGQNSSSSSNNKEDQAWNHAPPGSPIANNGNTHPNDPSSNQWWPQDAGNGNAPPINGGRQVENWLTKTPAGASASGHRPWGGGGGGSTQNNRNGGNHSMAGGASNKGGLKNTGIGNGGNGGNRNWNSDQNHGGSWNNDNNNGQNGWNTNNGNAGNGQASHGGKQTQHWNEGSGTGGAGGWNDQTVPNNSNTQW